MASSHILTTTFLLALLLPAISATTSSFSHESPQTFIIHVSESHKPPTFTTHKHWYSSIIRSLSAQSPHPSTKLLYAYNLAIHGFSAHLTPSQASHLRRIPGILSVVPESIRYLHTTHTPNFLGLADSFGIWPNSEYADDVIIGVLDTGIWPERPSFADEGLSDVRSDWKGVCQTGPDFPSCNKKIIGAKAFSKGYETYLGRPIDETKESKSPRDTEGHGTHTASTAAGSVVNNASFFEYAKGVARGMASKARISAYKICWSRGCFDSDILAAMDAAIDDAVDVISLSVGSSGYAPQYDYDSIAIGAFGAAKHGIVVSCSAGNSGPGSYTAVNIAPWILTVGASTIDREFPADVILGDGRIFGGVSLYSGEPLGDSLIPVVYAYDCGSRYCYVGGLNSTLVKGKIVLCDRGGNARVEKGSAVKQAGGIGMILENLADSGEELIADSHLIPATMVGQDAGDKIRSYVTSDPSPTATISFKGTVIGKSPSAPRVASFSSRGPNIRTREILKPDVIAPGVNILAGWTGYSAPTDLDIDPRRVEFNIISGTSMSCPHVSGLAGLLRKSHPNWSPAAIKSALMTTAYNLDNNGKKIIDLATNEESTPFIHGSGHVDPNRALHPGLIYDIDTKDYLGFLCAIGYTTDRIAVFIGHAAAKELDCQKHGLDNPGDLNYPSFSVVFKSNGAVVKYKRVVKNVGENNKTVYEVKVNAPTSVEVSVSPSKLVFDEGIDSLSYDVTFTSSESSESGMFVGRIKSAFGSIEWSDGVHLVRSPIAVVWRLDSVDSV